MRRAAIAAALALLLAALALAGCGCGGGSDGSGRLIVLGASSLTEAAHRVRRELRRGRRSRPRSRAPTSWPSRSSRAPGPTSSPRPTPTIPEQLFEEGLVEEPRVFAANELVVAVPEGSAIHSLSDLAEPGLKLVIGDPSVPVGSYTRTVLRRLPAGEREAILANVVSEETAVASIVVKLEQGAADAGFVYVTDERVGRRAWKRCAIPPELQPRVEYGVAVVSSSDEKPAAEEFVAGLIDGRGTAGPARRRVPAGPVRRSWFVALAVLAALATLAFLLVPVARRLHQRRPRPAARGARRGERPRSARR